MSAPTDSYNRYIHAIWHRLGWLVLASLLGAVITWGFLSRIEPAHQVHFSYVISLQEREVAADEYTFDGYYALQATELFTATMAELIRSPATIVAAFAAAELPVPTQDVRALNRFVQAQKQAPQVIQVTVTDSDPARAEQLADGLQLAVAALVEQYHVEGIPALTFSVVAGETWTARQALAVPVVAAAVFVGVFILGVNLVVLRETWR